MDFDQVRQEIKAIKKQVDSANKLLNDIVRLEIKRGGNLFKIQAQLTKLEIALNEISQTPTQVKEVLSWLERYRHELATAEEGIRKRFGSELADLLKEQGLPLSGQYPELKAGFFTVEVDFANQRAKLWYGPRQELLGQCNLATSKVVGLIKESQQQLGSGLDPNKFLKRLHDAYRRVADPVSDQGAPIIFVLGEIAYLLQDQRFRNDPIRENFRSYSRADFSYDLFRVRGSVSPQEIKQTLHLSVATRAQTRHRQDFLWVPVDKNGRGTTYSYILLKESNHA